MNTRLINDLLQGAMMAAVVAIAMPELAFAQGANGGAADLGTTSSRFAKEQLATIPNLISAVSYIAGIGFMVGGALQIKKYGENSPQEKLAPGIAKLAIGGVIAALPTFAGWINKSTTVGGNKLSNDTFTTNF